MKELAKDFPKTNTNNSGCKRSPFTPNSIVPKVNIREFLQDYKGYIQVDCYQVYEKLSDEITLVGCFAHARRPFAELKKIAGKASKNSITEKALDYLG